MKTTIITFVFAFLVVPATVRAATIDFDTFPDGSPVPRDVLITTQYASLGVVFSSDSPAGAPSAGVLAGEASSPPNLLYGDFVQPCACGLYRIFMTFSNPLPSRVDMTLISVGRGIATVTAFATNQTVLDTVSVTHGPSGGVGLGNHDPISLTGDGIANVRFEITQTGDPTDGIGIDDLSFYLQPRLYITTEATNVVVSWPVWATNFVLEAAPNLLPSRQWETVTNRVETAGERFSVSLPRHQPDRFFRLRETQP